MQFGLKCTAQPLVQRLLIRCLTHVIVANACMKVYVP